jgi:hypothetical protein
MQLRLTTFVLNKKSENGNACRIWGIYETGVKSAKIFIYGYLVHYAELVSDYGSGKFCCHCDVVSR